MSFMHHKSTFLTNGALVPASSYAELDIPPHPVGGVSTSRNVTISGLARNSLFSISIGPRSLIAR